MKTSILAALAASTVSARLGFGECPKVELQPNFDGERHAGQWYEAKRDKLFTWEFGQECGTQSYRKNSRGNYDLYFRAYVWMAGFSYVGAGGELRQCGTSNDWTCQATMGEDKYAADKKTSAINILATDYDNWSVMYVCSENGMGMHAKWLAISARTGKISDSALAEAEAAVAKQLPDFDLSNWSMWNTSHEDCEYDWNKWDNEGMMY